MKKFIDLLLCGFIAVFVAAACSKVDNQLEYGKGTINVNGVDFPIWNVNMADEGSWMEWDGNSLYLEVVFNNDGERDFFSIDFATAEQPAAGKEYTSLHNVPGMETENPKYISGRMKILRIDESDPDAMTADISFENYTYWDPYRGMNNTVNGKMCIRYGFE